MMLMLLAALAFGNSNVDVVTIPSGSFVMGCNDPNPSYVPRSSGVPTIEQLQKQKRDEAFMKECLEDDYTEEECLWQLSFRNQPVETTSQPTSQKANDCQHTEQPAHHIKIAQGFLMMKTEVSQRLYLKVTGKNPSSFTDCGSNCPVEQISFYDAVFFANKLSDFDNLERCYVITDSEVLWSNKDCKGWRLPTEAEWVYAAQGGAPKKYAGSNNLAEVGWYAENSSQHTHPSCRKKTNGYGLCDMNGNVAEWVWDYFGRYADNYMISPAGPESGDYRVLRGGSWRSSSAHSTIMRRARDFPKKRRFVRGFRLVRRTVK